MAKTAEYSTRRLNPAKLGSMCFLVAKFAFLAQNNPHLAAIYFFRHAGNARPGLASACMPPRRLRAGAQLTLCVGPSTYRPLRNPLADFGLFVALMQRCRAHLRCTHAVGPLAGRFWACSRMVQRVFLNPLEGFPRTLQRVFFRKPSRGFSKTL